LALASGWSASAAAEPNAAITPLARYQLQNGLRVILAPDSVTPGVSVVVRYDVGVADDPRGYRGLSHLVEHLTFRGSLHVAPLQGMSILQELGAGFNASTELEATEYYAQVAAPALDTVLWLESERMAFTLARLDQTALDVERRIVDNEQRERQRTFQRMIDRYWLRALYGEGHPFVGDPESVPDLSNVTLRGVQWFFQTAYRPDNATLTLVGQFDSAQALRSVEKYFGSIVPPPVLRAPRQASPPRLCGVHRLGLSHAGLFGHTLRITWPLARANSAPERASVNVLARLLRGKLYALLVERGVEVANVSATLNRFATHELLSVDLELLEKSHAAAVERAALAAARELASLPPAPHALRTTIANLLSNAVFRRENGLRRARELASGGDPDADAAALRKLEGQRVQRTAQPLAGPVLVVHVWPSKRTDGSAQVEEDENPCR
jgi:predicted Zn-dependent peptidase